VRFARGALLAAFLVAALRPELPRYRAERELRAATDAIRYVVTHPRDFPDPAAALDRIALVAAAAEAPLPGDPRPVVLEGSARLIQGEAQRALEIYRRALSLGERAETDLNLARAYERLGREPEARAAFLRAAWVSPVLLRAMLPDVAATAATEMARLERELKAGKLSAPPPLPE
jgi:tetratricopeptide (TPR) repeat protein